MIGSKFAEAFCILFVLFSVWIYFVSMIIEPTSMMSKVRFCSRHAVFDGVVDVYVDDVDVDDAVDDAVDDVDDADDDDDDDVVCAVAWC
jgi:hypothetical protein